INAKCDGYHRLAVRPVIASEETTPHMPIWSINKTWRREPNMTQVICSCGAVVSAIRTATGWDIKLGRCSIQRNCEELREARQPKATVENFNCKRLSRLVAERMRARRHCGSVQDPVPGRRSDG